VKKMPVLLQSASYSTVVPSNQSFPPGSPIQFQAINSVNSPDGTSIVIDPVSLTTIHLTEGTYTINYAVSIFNSSGTLKMILFRNVLTLPLQVIPSFTGGPVVGGTGHVAGNARIEVGAAGDDIQLRVDNFLSPATVTPFSNVTMIITKVALATELP
jgi:hypothetical protein